MSWKSIIACVVLGMGVILFQGNLIACSSACCDADIEVLNKQQEETQCHKSIDSEKQDDCGNSCDGDCGDDCQCQCCDAISAVCAYLPTQTEIVSPHPLSYLSPFEKVYSFEYSGSIWQPPKA